MYVSWNRPTFGMSSLNIDELISSVHKKPQLWDRANKFHSNRNVVDKSWREISVKLNVDENLIRKKWKYLRDQFSVEFGKMPPAACEGDVLPYEPKWRYYKPLQFLEEVVTPRVNTKNPRREDDSSESQDTSAPASPAPAHNGARPSRHSQRMVEKKKHKLRNARDKQKRMRMLESVNEEHMHFFKSLLPHVRSIPAHLQLSFRNRVQQVVEEYAYGPDGAEPAGGNPVLPNETFFITCDPEHTAKSEPPDSMDESQDNQGDDASS